MMVFFVQSVAMSIRRVFFFVILSAGHESDELFGL